MSYRRKSHRRRGYLTTDRSKLRRKATRGRGTCRCRTSRIDTAELNRLTDEIIEAAENDVAKFDTIQEIDPLSVSWLQEMYPSGFPGNVTWDDVERAYMTAVRQLKGKGFVNESLISRHLD